ncbi:hypothetical protein TIFTF001_009987 [Ficus carica]|uniref:Uncharacterized protein n=1 Tax=Ficus carica TaxID=3494 RepID=A0AA88D322_FICCA|nr:hypothetical protein TIFTF001_009987 [Ficus carica]
MTRILKEAKTPTKTSFANMPPQEHKNAKGRGLVHLIGSKAKPENYFGRSKETESKV